MFISSNVEIIIIMKAIMVISYELQGFPYSVTHHDSILDKENICFFCFFYAYVMIDHANQFFSNPPVGKQ